VQFYFHGQFNLSTESKREKTYARNTTIRQIYVSCFSDSEVMPVILWQITFRCRPNAYMFLETSAYGNYHCGTFSLSL